MLNIPTYQTINQVVAPGLFFWRREKRLLLRRWRRFMVLPETVLLVGALIFGGQFSNFYDYSPGHQAQAATGGIIQEGVVSSADRHRPKEIQKKLYKNPGSILSFTGDEVAAAFGYTDLKRHDGDMMVLQFRGESCILDVYVKNGGIPVNYEFRQRQKANFLTVAEQADVQPRSCVDDILKSRRI